MAEEGKLLSVAKLELFWVTFKDKNGNTRSRMVFKNPAGHMLLWDLGADKQNNVIMGGAIPFEDQEHLKVERLDSMTMTRCPSWLTDNISKVLVDTDHWVTENAPKKDSSGEQIRAKAEQAAMLDMPVIGGISG